MPGPYEPPNYNADMMQFLSQLQAGQGQGLGAPSSNPPSGMSPSMPWMGEPQGYMGGGGPVDMGQMGMGPQDMGGYDPSGGMDITGMGPDMGYAPQGDWQDPGYSSFNGQPMQQPQQQGPTGHPILDKLLSPDMKEKAMAAAIFARGFVKPDEAINWAMQIRQQRQAQEARAEQSASEMDARKEIAKQKAEYDKQAKAATQANSILARADSIARQTPGGLDINEYEGFSDPNFDPNDPVKANDVLKWVQHRDAQAKADKATADKQKKDEENERKVAQLVLKTGQVPSNYTKSEIVNSAAEAHRTATAKEDENKRIVNELTQARTKRVNQLVAKGGKDTNSKEWASTVKLQGQAFTERNSLEKQLNFLRQSTAIFASLPDTDPLKMSNDALTANLTNSFKEWDMKYQELTDKLNGLADADVTPVKSSAPTTPAPTTGAKPKPSEDTGVEIPDDVRTGFEQRYMANPDPAYRAKLEAAIAKRFPGVIIESLRPAE